MSSLLSRFSAGLFLSLVVSACTVFESGSPSAALTFYAPSSFRVQDALELAFRDEGYRVGSRDLSSITFERGSTGTDRLMYGNWLENDVTQRVVVTVSEAGDGRFRVRCLPSVVSNASSISFEDSRRRLQLFSPHYTHLLREARRKLEKGSGRDVSGDQ